MNIFAIQMASKYAASLPGARLRRGSNCLAAAVLALLGAASICAQYPDFMPQRGVYPNGAYAFDKLETINKLNGTLTYTIPITSLPLGRGGLTVPVNLTYSSALADNAWISTSGANPESYTYATSSAWGGWFISGFAYDVVEENGPSSKCTSAPYRLSVVMPDGAHHVMHLYGQSDNGSGLYFYDAFSGQNLCTSKQLPNPLTYYSSDASYIRVVSDFVAKNWTIYFPDGKKVSQSYGPASNGQTTQTIQDRTGNKVVITMGPGSLNASVPVSLASKLPNPLAATLTDDLGRTITISGSTITQSGADGNALVWTMGNFASYSFPLICSPGDGLCNPGSSGQPGSAGNYYGGGPQSLTIPSDSGTLQYGFSYDSGTGVLQSVTLPSGAKTAYTFGNAGAGGYAPAFWVTQKQVTWTDFADGGNSIRSEIWKYNYGALLTANCPSCSVVIHPDNGQEITRFVYIGGTLGGLVQSDYLPDGSGTEYEYKQNPPFYENSTTDSANPYPAVIAHIAAATGAASLAAIEQRTIDQNGNLLGDSKYDWIPYSSLTHSNGSLTGFTGGQVLQQATNTYTVPVPQAVTGTAGPPDNANGYWSPSAPVLRGLLARSVVAGAGTGSASEFSYDTNGNETQERRWDSNKASTLPSSLSASNSNVTQRSFDSHGNILSTTDPNNVSTTYTYDSNSLYVAKQVQASGTAVQRTFNYTWNNYLGLATSKTDVDNSVNTAYAYDRMGRQTNVTEGAGLATRSTQTTYDDVNLQVTTKRDQNVLNDGALVSTTTYDQLYRVALVKQLETPTDPTGIKVQTRYLYSGNSSFKLVSNPFRAPTSSAASGEQTMGWLLFTYDQNGRVIANQSFSGTGLPSPWGSSGSSTGTVTTTYNTPTAQSTRVIDQAGSQRDTSIDGLGRLISVTEYPSSGSTYSTSYSYDVLGDLTNVNQSGQVRVFAYDSLERLLGVNNPESYTTGTSPSQLCGGSAYTLCYSYDGVGNLLTKTDNRGAKTSYAYDALNRVISKIYSVPTGVVATPGAIYCYDSIQATGCPSVGTVPYSRGRLTAVTNGNSMNLYTNFDALGRILNHVQNVGKQSYAFTYTYNLADSLTSESYPSGRTIATCYDGANRVSQVGLAACGSSAGAYVGSVVYAAHGSPASYAYGNTVGRIDSYNSRLQLSGFLDAKSGSASPFLNVALNWGTTQNNGNLQGAMYVHQGGAGLSSPLTLVQSYTYDGVNRLSGLVDNNYARTFSYDPYGNMFLSYTAPVADLPISGNTPTSYAYNYHNQFTSSVYDAAGNETSVNGNTVSYDAEGRQTNVTGAGVNESYVYDGDGKRVEKIGSGANPPTTVFVYDALGRLAAEYATAVDTPTCITCYLSADHLGTPRLVTDQNGNVVARHDYLPFGEEFAAGQGGRGPLWGAGNDSITEKFTAKERDAESGLDYFGARYYGSALGRFTSADPKLIPDEFDNPQSWNKYAYTGNNPLRYTDPDGKDWKDVVSGAFNAIGSDNAFGAGRQSGNSDFRTGQAIGDGVALVQGAAQVLFGAGGDVGGGFLTATGIGAVVGVPAIAVSTAVGVDGAGVAATAAGNLITQASALGPKQGANEPGSGKDFNSSTKADAMQENQAANGGQAKCVFCGESVGEGTGNKVNIDHAQAKANGGGNGLNNANVACEYCNKSKGTGDAPKNPKPCGSQTCSQ